MKASYIVIASFVFVLFSCGQKYTQADIPVSSIKLTPESLTLAPGDSYQLEAQVLPDNATDKRIEWITDRPDVVSVHDGLVTALTEGIAAVTARSGLQETQCKVTVVSNEDPIDQLLLLDRTELFLRAGASATLTATVLPDNSTPQNVIWTSNVPDLVRVDNGTVTALQHCAEATITAVTGSLKATCLVHAVSEQPEAIDLGLSVLWSNVNAGAYTPSSYDFSMHWSDAEYRFNSNTSPLKYNAQDGLLQLEPEDDLATVLYGNGWRTPTPEELTELSTQCTWEYVIRDYVNPFDRYEVTGSNGNKIYFPINNTWSFLTDDGWGISIGTCLWSSRRDEQDEMNARILVVSKAVTGIYSESRQNYHSLRPVKDK